MIKSISLQNFQSHKDNELVLHDNVNVVLGASDSGKSAILRAIRWVVFHKPAGDEMRSHWGGKTSVELTTDDCSVVKSKDKEQEYILDDLHFKAFGTEVPDEIAKALNMDTCNIQNQLDSPYLLSETPGAVASHFNKVAHLEKIDTGLQKINSSIRELTADIKYSEGQETNLTEGLDKFKHLEMFEADVEVLEETEKQLTTKCSQRNKLDVCVGRLIEVNEEIKEESKLLEFEKPLEQIFKWKEERIDVENNRKALSVLLFDIDIAQDEINKQNCLLFFEKLVEQILKWKEEREDLRTYVDELNIVLDALKVTKEEINEQNKLLSFDVPVNSLLKLHESRKTLVEGQGTLFKLTSSLSGINDRISKGNAFILLKNEEWEKEMPDICPLCGMNRIRPNMTK
jgi:exonuclease SbcC